MFLAPISESVWDMKYRLRDPGGAPVEASVADTWDRVARALARAEPDPAPWEPRFRAALEGFRFLPAGRIVAGAGTERSVTLFNCFVMGTIEDSISGIFSGLREAALTMQAGGGIGYDFSTIRPKGTPVLGVGADASGPLSFMDVWDAMCRTIMSAGSRRGAMMACLRCDHPDIEEFVEAKRDPARLRMFNVSVLVTDPFIAAVRSDAPWPLVFGGRTQRIIRARDLWDRIMRATYDTAEPGVVFIDRVNATNNLRCCETIAATNPCGEQPLPPYGACLLGSINLARLVLDPFEPGARLDQAALDPLVATAVRMLDNVVDLSRFPLPQQAAEARAKRRIGLGVTGLADALYMLGLRYGSPEAAEATGSMLRAVARAAYLASAELAAEKGPFPLCDRDALLDAPMLRRLPEEVRAAVRRHGLRNALLTSIAPTGTISLLAGNVSSGIEPVFAHTYRRKLLQPDGSRIEEEVVDHAVALWRELRGDAPLPAHFVTAQGLEPLDHIRMQAAAQEWVDSSISKTVNVPEDIPFEAFKDVYLAAWEMGCKGCTTYRPNPVTGSVLAVAPQAATPEPVGEGGSEADLPKLDTVGERLAWAMEQKGLRSPAQLAKQAGLAHNYISKIQRSDRELGREAAQKVAVALGVSPGWLLFGEEPRPASNTPTPPAAPILDRPDLLDGTTYKLKWPASEHAIYVTVNDTVVDGRRRPFEVFINSKNMEHYAWTVALTRMISAVFRRGGDVAFVVDELKAVFDPRGGAWLEGRYIPSILAAIGGVIERHMIRTGFLAGFPDGPLSRRAAPAGVADPLPAAAPAPSGPACPSCGSHETRLHEGCLTCEACGISRCA
jgi:ribonucleoside-diphosphate reductase alpha chain